MALPYPTVGDAFVDTTVGDGRGRMMLRGTLIRRRMKGR